MTYGFAGVPFPPVTPFARVKSALLVIAIGACATSDEMGGTRIADTDRAPPTNSVATRSHDQTSLFTLKHGCDLI